MEISQSRTSLLKWSSMCIPTQENYFLVRFYQKLIEVMLEIGLMSDIFMNWRRAKSDIFFSRPARAWKNAFILPTFFKWCEIKGISKRGKNDIQPFQILTWKEIELSPTATNAIFKEYDFTLLSWPFAQCEDPLCKKKNV